MIKDAARCSSAVSIAAPVASNSQGCPIEWNSLTPSTSSSVLVNELAEEASSGSLGVCRCARVPWTSRKALSWEKCIHVIFRSSVKTDVVQALLQGNSGKEVSIYADKRTPGTPKPGIHLEFLKN